MSLIFRASCPVCEDKRLNTISQLGRGHHVVRCANCFLEFVDPVYETGYDNVKTSVSTITSPSYVAAMKSSYDIRRHLVQRRAERRFDLYKNLLGNNKPARILEVGSGTGWLVRAFSLLGVDSTGIEVDGDLVAHATILGANVRQADVCKINPAEWLTFDVICAHQVLEHILTPRLALKNISQMLRPGGILHVDVPNADSWGGARPSLSSHIVVLWCNCTSTSPDGISFAFSSQIVRGRGLRDVVYA